MAQVVKYNVRKNLHHFKEVTCTGNLAALLIAVFGNSAVKNLDRCNISVAENGRVQAKFNTDIYTVEAA